MKKSHCPFCGEKTYSHYAKNVEITYKNKTVKINQPGTWCSTCNEGLISPADRKATQKELQAFKASVDGLLSPDEVRRIRKKLKLTQRQASGLFGGGVNAFSRYEKGEIPIYRATSQALKLLDNHPSQLKELIQNNNDGFSHAFS